MNVQRGAQGSTISPVSTSSAPAAVGPYSAGIRTTAAELIFVSGQLPLDPTSGEMVTGDADVLVRRALANGLAIVEAAGSSLERIVKVTVFLTDLGSFELVNRAYGEFFGEWRPARSVVEVSRLPRGSVVEVEMIATCPATSDSRESS